MFKDAFEKLDLAQSATILDKVNPLLEGVEFDPVETTVMAIDAPFYPGFQFLDIANNTVSPSLQRYALYSPDKVTILDFTNEPIYAMNRQVPIHLTKDNVTEYVRFFFTFVRGRHGRFLIAETVDDINWREEPPPAARKAIGKMLNALKLKEKPGAGYFMEACMVFKDSLFKSNINVSPEGFVQLSDEELLIEDMPVMDDTFGQ